MAVQPSKRIQATVFAGVRRDQTQRALLLALGFFVVTGTIRAVILPNVHTPPLLYDLVSASLEAFRFESIYAPIGFGPVTIAGLAAIHGRFNEGYIPSLLLASAPSYGFYVFNGPGAAPIWAIQYIGLEVVMYGTIGFLLGLSFRWCRRMISISIEYKGI